MTKENTSGKFELLLTRQVSKIQKYERYSKMNGKAKRQKRQVVPNNSVLNVMSQEELGRKMAEVASSLKASTWRDLETHGKFGKNE